MIARLRRIVLDDWPLKLSGILIAAALWAVARSDRAIELTLRVPLELRNAPRARFLSKPPGSLTVRLEVDREAVPRLNLEAVRAVVDLSGASSRRVEISLTTAHILRPLGVRVLSISPSQLVLEFADGRLGP